MGACLAPAEEPPPPPPPVVKQNRPPPRPPPTAEELEAQRREKEEAARWEEKARQENPPPFPKPEFAAGGSEGEYKDYMVRKLEYQAWENKIVLIARRMRKEFPVACSRCATLEFKGQTSKKVLAYGDTVLTELELQFLEPGQWLNDNIIHFYFDWLTDKWKKPAQLHLVCPSTMFLIGMTDDSNTLGEMLAPLNLAGRELVCMPINNNNEISKAGGSHWSLLVFSRRNGSFRHFDSSGGMNNRAAQRTAKAMAPLLGAKGANVETVACPQQDNSSDCGVFTLAFAEAIGSAYLASKDDSGAALQRLNQPAISAMRRSIAALIRKLASEHDSKRS